MHPAILGCHTYHISHPEVLTQFLAGPGLSTDTWARVTNCHLLMLSRLTVTGVKNLRTLNGPFHRGANLVTNVSRRSEDGYGNTPNHWA
jgi:hypothetical protein